jgi:hypothetical protein
MVFDDHLLKCTLHSSILFDSIGIHQDMIICLLLMQRQKFYVGTMNPLQRHHSKDGIHQRRYTKQGKWGTMMIALLIQQLMVNIMVDIMNRTSL